LQSAQSISETSGGILPKRRLIGVLFDPPFVLRLRAPEAEPVGLADDGGAAVKVGVDAVFFLARAAMKPAFAAARAGVAGLDHDEFALLAIVTPMHV
jgi:hypothetical protein